MLTTIIGTTCVASAATAQTDYGTMTYYLKKNPNNYIVASTYMPANAKPYSYIKTTLEIQINSTGKTIKLHSNPFPYVQNSAQEAIIISDKTYTCKLAAFSAHEVVGKKGFVKYCKTTF